MSIEQTLCIIKPEAVTNNSIGAVCTMIENKNLRIVAMLMTRLDIPQVESFYAEHSKRHFFSDLVAYICSGPVVIMVLEGEDAILNYRQLMGATDPADAEPGTIRRELAVTDPDTDMLLNVVHGSDSMENAKREIALFFDPEDIYPRY